MRLYHTTTAENAEAIKRGGFRDGEGTYLTRCVWRGVWLSDVPLDANAGAEGEDVLVVDIPEEAVAQYEWVQEGRPGHREFLVPAEVVNKHPIIEHCDL